VCQSSPSSSSSLPWRRSIRFSAEFSEHGIKAPALYADDASVLFQPHADQELGALLPKQHLTRLGLVTPDALQQDEPGQRSHEQFQDKGRLLSACWLRSNTDLSISSIASLICR
jgi:hypothetical protein